MQTITTSIPADICSLADYERQAQSVLSAQNWAYIAGDAADGLTRQRNRQAFDQLLLQQRILTEGLGEGHCSIELLGQQLQSPLLIAPVAYQKLAHPMGELASIQAANAQGAGFVLSTLSSYTLEDVAAAAPEGPRWFQLYYQPDQTINLELIRRAEAAGYQALVITTDAPINGVRNAEQRVNFRLPNDVEAVNLRGQLPTSQSSDSVFAGWMSQAPTWESLSWLLSQTRLPVILKGVMSPLDAKQAVDAGVSGLIVSNHGGRVLDSQPASIEVLAAIRNAVPDDLPILLDSGVRRGSDIFKTIALGANAVMIGRPVLYAMAIAGPLGVAHCLRILRDELEATMVLCGCKTTADINRECLYQGQRWF